MHTFTGKMVDVFKSMMTTPARSSHLAERIRKLLEGKTQNLTTHIAAKWVA
jgi:hypothetical protein